MFKDIFNNIKNEISIIIDLEKLDDILYKHFYLARLIRNKYLYNNNFNKQILSRYYKTQNIDDLSFLILEDVIKDLKS